MKKLTCLSIVLAALVAPWIARADFIYNDFSSIDGLKLNGVAAQAGNVLRLTTPNTYVGGSVFTTQQTTLGNLNSFSTYFQFQMTDPGGISDDDGTGADGIVFVVQTEANNVGSLGSGIGYEGISPSLGIEFDTFKNSAFNDPNGNHVGINLNGNPVSIATAIEPTRFNNGQVWNAWVNYDGTTGRLEVRWSMSSEKPADAQLSATVSLTKIFGQDTGFVGFTAATGSAYENQDILHWEYQDSFLPPAVPVITSAVTAAGQVGSSFVYQITAANLPTSFGVSGLPAGLGYDPTTGIISGVPTVAGEVNVTVTASNNVGTATGSIDLTIGAAAPSLPFITSPVTASGQFGVAFNYQIVGANSPLSFGAVGLPAGLTVDVNTGLVAGIPTESGTLDITLFATNATGTGYTNLVLVIRTADADFPTITSANTAAGLYGVSFLYQIVATDFPTSFAATGLPDGLTLDPVSGAISGRPTVTGTFQVLVSASNASGADVLILTLVIQPFGPGIVTPVITSPAAVSCEISQPFSYQITAASVVVSYTAVGLPLGLTLDPVTGLITGTPTQTGAFQVTLGTLNGAGTGVLNLQLIVFTVPTVTLSVKGDGVAIAGGEVGKAILTRTGDISTNLVVAYQIKGTAVNGVDYNRLKNVAVILAGHTSTKLKVHPILDPDRPGTRKVKFLLQADPNGSYIVGDGAKAKITLLNNG